MGDMIYREARLEEYEKIGKLLANSFLDYPFLTIITDDLKKPDSYPAFVEHCKFCLLESILKKETVWLRNKMENYLQLPFCNKRSSVYYPIYEMVGQTFFATFDHKISLNTLTL